MEPRVEIHASCMNVWSKEEKWGVRIWLAVGKTVVNEAGDSVPGIVLTADEAREFARAIRRAAKDADSWLEFANS